ncbi:MAG: hypothetical protein CTY10_07810 [Methylotenera sp.]|nr:MAG: hypothetical protein CTY10_07810 [Methylotenera sp.]
MSKISPIQAQALGLKPTDLKTPALKTPIPKTAAKKPAAKTPVKASAATKPTTAKPAVKSTIAKPAVAKPTPTASKNIVKKAVKKDSKLDDKKPKSDKVKMERDSFTMPKDEYAQIALLKARLTSMGQPAKKSELLRAGIKLLAAMSDNTLKTTLAKIPVIKTGRPNKKD